MLSWYARTTSSVSLLLLYCCFTAALLQVWTKHNVRFLVYFSAFVAGVGAGALGISRSKAAVKKH
jgi:hypothetical protein